jgi:hypothetical protein
MVMRDPCSVQAGRSPLLSQPLSLPADNRSDQSSKRGLMPAQLTPLKTETLTLTLTLTLTPTLTLTLTLTLTPARTRTRE